ncbi:hypothetical protein KC327_g1, partial [Hortaea werneckii]
ADDEGERKQKARLLEGRAGQGMEKGRDGKGGRGEIFFLERGVFLDSLLPFKTPRPCLSQNKKDLEGDGKEGGEGGGRCV